MIDFFLCGSLCLLCDSLCNKKENYTELHREDTENHRVFPLLRFFVFPNFPTRNDGCSTGLDTVIARRYDEAIHTNAQKK